MTSPADARTPLTLITGLLGSGKTTLINALVARPELARTLVVVCESGVVECGHRLVVHASASATTGARLRSMCQCCATPRNLHGALRDADWRFSRNGMRQFDRVVVEVPGAANPSTIVQRLQDDIAISERYRVAGVVIVEAREGGVIHLARRIDHAESSLGCHVVSADIPAEVIAGLGLAAE